MPPQNTSLAEGAVDDDVSSHKLSLLKRRRDVMTSANILFYESSKQELLVERAEGQWMFDEEGNRYLDLINNVAHVGHCNPKVTAAVTAQMQKQYTNSRYLNSAVIEYSEHLLKHFPQELNTVLFCNSGSEATDLALRLSSYYNGKSEYICLKGGYHGHVQSALDVSPYKWKGGAVKQPEHVHAVDAPDAFRGKHKGNYAGEEYAKDVAEVISRREGKISAYIAESILSCAGQILLPPGYLKAVYKYCRENGVLTIADEVQVGFGRVGSKMWAFELQDVVPDIVTLGKPIANGFPMAAVVTRREIAEAYWKSGSQYFNTFGGNAVAAAAGLAVLKEIEESNLRQNALEVGEVFLRGFEDLKQKNDIIADVRGFGLFLGIELINSEGLPAMEEAYFVRNRLLEDRVIISVDGPDENILKLKPPMCITKENAEMVLEKMNAVFNKLK
ncbi:Oidioi.mRNA.OKI2018_I69.chr2.g4896.t1.cds [Oikopleura dioica]|uniref:Oidioi.mRNA.OKI2018_I69.chr2.g4896.t1.cds n=1 Tax=Oikopleura dioica TaxID=34765 RepID=A0ABN7T2H0_OIKDI|nr:Oidioi.mRNA.OKI2018_I69.chr2.g4896.t1.cds [Oikopleura dioica]